MYGNSEIQISEKIYLLNYNLYKWTKIIVIYLVIVLLLIMLLNYWSIPIQVILFLMVDYGSGI